MSGVPGVILAGGLATRMGGGDKCLLELASRPLLAHVIERLAPQAGPLALNANGDPARFAPFGLPVLPDSVPGFPGPLAGVLAGLDWAQALGAAQIVTVAADTPFFPTDLVARLQAGTRKVVAWPDRHGAANALFDVSAHDPFFNINTPEDLERARRILAEQTT